MFPLAPAEHEWDGKRVHGEVGQGSEYSEPLPRAVGRAHLICRKLADICSMRDERNDSVAGVIVSCWIRIWASL
jgi:hypothetical protein